MAQRAVLGRIESLSLSLRKKSKRNKILAGVIAGVVVVACAVTGILLGVNHASAAPDYYADIEIQDYGTVTVQLDAEAAPITVENFVNLAESGFYDGLTFHRIIDGFMMQGGDPEGDGTGGSDTTIKGEFSDNGVENNLSHTRGAISMARSSDYDSASSQFFIVQEDSTYLDGQYACFGYVTEGMDIVDEICTSAQPTDDNGTISADQQPVITSITIREGE
ncbi:MAG TPA: peptidylprolyl isomerase [Candidatus Egerieicola faecale]|uniref:Peptidyl-prolyl cis-trans isomerase n=1 Tax=Candidatus Egerieicola faecale TaxID=2840774 RepID=A0A9D1ISE5_9FIRM|nr:peptidylprolyl isomerase [Candidatus Egerieicola faecale]